MSRTTGSRRKPTPPLSDLMRSPAAMAYVQRSRSTLYEWEAAGLITRYKVGGATYWSRTELDALVRRAGEVA